MGGCGLLGAECVLVRVELELDVSGPWCVGGWKDGVWLQGRDSVAEGSDTPERGGLSTSTGLANPLSTSTGRSEERTLAVLPQQPIGGWGG